MEQATCLNWNEISPVKVYLAYFSPPEVKLGRAEKLLHGLGSEAERWYAASDVLEKAMGYVIGNIMLA